MNNDNKLNKILEEFKINSLLNTAKEAEQEVFIWRLVGGSKYLASVKIETIRKARKDFLISPIEGHECLVQDMLSSQNFIDLYVPESAMLFRCNIKQAETPSRYFLEFPEFVAQVERRKHLRLNVYRSEEVKINFAKSMALPKNLSQQFSKSCFDISAGGFSFFVSRIESKFFQINDPIRNIEVTIDGWGTKVSAQIALIKEIEPDESNGLTYKVWRVCCRFTQIDQKSKNHLEKYIFERINADMHVISV